MRTSGFSKLYSPIFRELLLLYKSIEMVYTLYYCIVWLLSFPVIYNLSIINYSSDGIFKGELTPDICVLSVNAEKNKETQQWKFWANLDNPVKSYEFSKFWLNPYVRLLTLATLPVPVMSRMENSPLVMYTNKKIKKSISSKLQFPLTRYGQVYGRAKMIIIAFLRRARSIAWFGIPEKWKLVKIYVQNQWGVVHAWHYTQTDGVADLRARNRKWSKH